MSQDRFQAEVMDELKMQEEPVTKDYALKMAIEAIEAICGLHESSIQILDALNACKEALEIENYVPFEGLFIDIRYKDKNVQFGNRRVFPIEMINLTYFPTMAGQEAERMIRDIFGENSHD